MGMQTLTRARVGTAQYTAAIVELVSVAPPVDFGVRSRESRNVLFQQFPLDGNLECLPFSLEAVSFVCAAR